jgi:hypothetical protein
MPTSHTRHRVEIPTDLYRALNQAAAAAGMPTSALITRWLWTMLEQRRRDLHVRDPHRRGQELYERRPRRPGEIADGPVQVTLPADSDRDTDEATRYCSRERR